MATKKKMLQAAAGNAAAYGGGAGGLNVEDVFSTYLYEGNGSANVIDNGINLGQSNSGGSAYFSKGVLNIADDASFQFGSGDWTVETFFYAQASTHEDGTNQNPVFISWGDDANNRWDMGWQDPNNPRVFVKIGGTNYDIYGGATHAITNYVGQWVHFAATRNGSTLRFFINGSQVASGSISGNMPDPNTGGVYIGARSYATTSAYNDTNTGFISNMRVVKGTALYTSSFTAPTSALTAVSGTSLLAFTGDEPLNDTSSNAHTITQAGNATDAVAKTFGPFDAADAGEGGLVWIKNRTGADNHWLADTERGTSVVVSSSGTFANVANNNRFASFNSNGFSLGNNGSVNGGTYDYASWTFRKAPKFFTCLTYSGTGTAQNISHDLGAVPAAIFVKQTSGSTRDWNVYHRGVNGGSNPEGYYLRLQGTEAAAANANKWNNTAPTDTVFTVGTAGSTNASGETYVAYLFAHNDGDGDFGPTGDQDIIKCGSYTGGSGNTEIDLGFEPQWLMIKRTDSAEDWLMLDVMRGLIVSGDDVASTGQKDIMANLSSAEVTPSYAGVSPQPNGFKVRSGLDGIYSSNGGTYIYIAIRRGPMAVPTDATDVFAMDTLGGTSPTPPGWVSGFPVDMSIYKHKGNTSDWVNGARLMGGNYLIPSTTNSQATLAGMQFDFQNGYWDSSAVDSQYVSWMWRRAPSFCDVVAYSGNSTAGRTVSHNLGVAPEMIWVKARNFSRGWNVYHKDLTPSGGQAPFMELNASDAVNHDNSRYPSDPTDTAFIVGSSDEVNSGNYNYIAYLFASLDGVSKVGSYTGTGTGGNQIDCGFSSGARFVLIKAASSAGSWNVFDTERGIVAGNDARLKLNNTNAEDSTSDIIDPYNSGFELANDAGDTNSSGVTYIFYAIA